MSPSWYKGIVLVSCLLMVSCGGPSSQEISSDQLPIHKDLPFVQDYSIKYYLRDTTLEIKRVSSDRNGNIKILTSAGLYHPGNAAFLYPGFLVPDERQRPMKDRKLSGLTSCSQQLVFLDDRAVFSNAWAGSLHFPHSLALATMIAGGARNDFMISDGSSFSYLENGKPALSNRLGEEKILDIQFDASTQRFYMLTANGIFRYVPGNSTPEKLFSGAGFTCFTPASNGKELVVGTNDGFLRLNPADGAVTAEIDSKLPWPEITSVAEIDGKLWFGTTRGAFMMRDNKGFNYYFGERWLPGNNIIQIAPGPEGSVLVLTSKGLARIEFQPMTLHEKALFYEKQVRDRHIRYGFNASLSGMNHGDIYTGFLSDSDNDGLWTAMYLGGQAFRYAVTRSEEALENCRESMEAMERLYSINPVPGFPSRSFERRGYIGRLADPDRWQPAEDPEWDWKSTTSSDEAIGHIFAFAVVAELVDDHGLKQKAVTLIDTLMQHVVENDFYLVDFDGKPTMWGRWHPDYVNARPEMVGDRKLNSSNIVSMLQTAFHFTGKEIYREKARELMVKHGYLENLLRPISEIGKAPEDADDWSKMLSESWNHSDDEMYYMGYWGLYRYPFADSLQPLYRQAILDHWEYERSEKEGLWNIFTSITGTSDFDLEEAIWYLQEHPLDLVDWAIANSHRKDLEFMTENFRRQTTKEVLPPDERPVQRHNSNMFNLDRNRGNGNSEHSAGDIWLLPYWMGRYMNIISEPL